MKLKTRFHVLNQTQKYTSGHMLHKIYSAKNKSVDTISFSGEAWRKLLSGLQDKVDPQNIIGSGAEANVYLINESYVLRMPIRMIAIDSEFHPVKDDFEGRNFGQAVAKTKNGISINKRVLGANLYECGDTNPQRYMENLRKYANLSDDILDSFVSDVAFINSKGWRIDQTNPENFLFNEKSGKIHIIDLCKKNASSLDYFEPYGHDWILNPLVNGHDVISVYQKLSIEERKEMFELIGKLEKRILSICRKYGIPKAKWNKKHYSVDSLINLLDLRKKINVSTCDNLHDYIFHKRYTSLLEKYELYKIKFFK